MNILDIQINEENSMIEAMQILDQVAKKVLFVVQGEKLIASITDGDIRRWILKKGNLDAQVKDIANYHPKCLLEKDKAEAREYMHKMSIEALPIVDENRQIVSVVFLNDGVIEPKREINLPVVIMAGGFGTRLYPYTKILPKPLIPIGDLPIAEHIINKFHKYGCQKFLMILNHKKNMIKAYFNEVEKDYAINFIDEDKPLGTGGGLSLLKGQVKTTFILSNCDIIINEDFEKIYKFHRNENNMITMICSLKRFKIPYGVIEIGETGEIKGMQEKPELSFFTNTGVYIVEPRLIEELEEDQEMSFPDIIERYKKSGERIGVYPISENSWMDMGQFDEMEKMNKRLIVNE